MMCIACTKNGCVLPVSYLLYLVYCLQVEMIHILEVEEYWMPQHIYLYCLCLVPSSLDLSVWLIWKMKILKSKYNLLID